MQSIAPASGKRTAAVSSSTSSPTWASSSSMPFILFYCFLLNIYLLYLYDHLTHEYKTMWLSHCEKQFFSVWNFCIFFEHRLNACLEVLNVKMWQNARNFTQKRAPWTFSTTGHLCKQSIQQLHSVQLQCTSTSELQIATMVIFTSFFDTRKTLKYQKIFPWPLYNLPIAIKIQIPRYRNKNQIKDLHWTGGNGNPAFALNAGNREGQASVSRPGFFWGAIVMAMTMAMKMKAGNWEEKVNVFRPTKIFG